VGSEKIKLRILVPLTVAITGLLGAFVSGSFRIQQHALDDEVHRYVSSVRKVLRARHHTNVELLSGTLDNLLGDRALCRSFIQRDRNQLHHTLKSTFWELARNHDVTHFYVHDIDGVNFLRVHQPGAYGDTLRHTTLNRARNTGRPFFGMELSSSGAFTLSIVVPWHIEGQLAGFIELGKEFKQIAKDIPDALGIEMITFIDKELIERKAWEAEYGSAGNSPGWTDFTDFAVIDNTFGEPLVDLDQWLLTTPGDEIAGKTQVAFENRTFSVAFFSLIDVENRHVGKVAIFYDATKHILRTRRLLIMVSAMSLLIGVALFVSFYKMLDSIEKELAESRERTMDENRHRLEIEQKHARELAAHVVELELARARSGNTVPPANDDRRRADRTEPAATHRPSRSSK
jgi:two-component system NtrC family sensor kinase